MPQTSTTTVIRTDEATTRVTSARALYRNKPAQNRIMLVPANADPLLEKESDCCSRATD